MACVSVPALLCSGSCVTANPAGSQGAGEGEEAQQGRGKSQEGTAGLHQSLSPHSTTA